MEIRGICGGDVLHRQRLPETGMGHRVVGVEIDSLLQKLAGLDEA